MPKITKQSRAWQPIVKTGITLQQLSNSYSYSLSACAQKTVHWTFFFFTAFLQVWGLQCFISLCDCDALLKPVQNAGSSFMVPGKRRISSRLLKCIDKTSDITDCVTEWAVWKCLVIPYVDLTKFPQLLIVLQWVIVCFVEIVYSVW